MAAGTDPHQVTNLDSSPLPAAMAVGSGRLPQPLGARKACGSGSHLSSKGIDGDDKRPLHVLKSLTPPHPPPLILPQSVPL